MATHTDHPAASDKGPAFIGMIVGALVIAALLYSVVLWTNSRFAAHAGAAPAAQH